MMKRDWERVAVVVEFSLTRQLVTGLAYVAEW